MLVIIKVFSFTYKRRAKSLSGLQTHSEPRVFIWQQRELYFIHRNNVNNELFLMVNDSRLFNKNRKLLHSVKSVKDY
jgi:hypothetical protein